MEEEKILTEEKESLADETSGALPPVDKTKEELEGQNDSIEVLSPEELTEEERLEREKRRKRQERLQPIKYFLCAASAGIIQFVVSTLLSEAILNHFIDENDQVLFIVWLNKITFIADTVGLALSIVWNFTLNRKFTFKDAGNVPLAMFLAFLFYVPFYPFQVWYIDTIRNAIIVAGGHKTLAFIVALGTCMFYNLVLEFLWQKFVVFRKPKKQEEKA